MEFRVVTLPETRLIGMRMRMSYVNNRTSELWRSFMPRRREIVNPASADLYSVQQYDAVLGLETFDPAAEFNKWAAVPVSDFSHVPEGMVTHTIPGGLYAVFHYRGDPRAFEPVFLYIFGEWMPKSAYGVDHRVHFEVLGEKYKNNDPDSEEDIWVPVKPKAGSLD